MSIPANFCSVEAPEMLQFSLTFTQISDLEKVSLESEQHATTTHKKLRHKQQRGPPKQYKTRSMARASPKLSQDLTKLVSIDEDEDDSDAVLPSPARRKRRGTEKAQYTKDVVDNVEEDSEDEIRPSLIKRRATSLIQRLKVPET
jgi:hypothetical protein